MTPKIRDWLLAIAAIVVVFYFGWTLYTVSVQSLWNLNIRVINSEQQLIQCRAQLNAIKK